MLKYYNFTDVYIICGYLNNMERTTLNHSL